LLLNRLWPDVETIEKMAVLEFKHGDAERGKTLFEGLVDRYPRRLDLWSVYIDQLAKADDIQGARLDHLALPLQSRLTLAIRGIFDRVLSHKLTRKKAKYVDWFSLRKSADG